MFSNLSKGSVLYGLEIKDTIVPFASPIESVSLPKPIYNQTFGQPAIMVVDIVASVNGERREFKQVPGNDSIANFGSGTYILADSKDTLNAHINSLLQNSRNIVNSVDKHKALITQYEKALKDLNPTMYNSSDDSAVKDLKEQVSNLQSQLNEALTLLKAAKPQQQI